MELDHSKSVHVFNASTGATVGYFRDSSTDLSGTVRSSLAAFKGRLYVLTTGDSTSSYYPRLYCFN